MSKRTRSPSPTSPCFTAQFRTLIRNALSHVYPPKDLGTATDGILELLVPFSPDLKHIIRFSIFPSPILEVGENTKQALAQSIKEATPSLETFSFMRNDLNVILKSLQTHQQTPTPRVR